MSEILHPEPAWITRRRFLRTAGGAVLGLGLLPLAGCESNLVEPLVEGTVIPFLTPTDDFFVQYGGAVLSSAWGGVQQIDEGAWRLTIDGLVRTPLTLTFDDIEALQSQSVTMIKTMRCITDSTAVPGLVGTALWTGVPLRVVLDRAGVDRQRARRLRFYGSDGFTNNLPLNRVYGTQPPGLVEPLLVYAMNGAPLTAEHGFPVRLVVYEQYGYKNVKWLSRIEATQDDTPFGTYQEVLGFVDDGVMRVVNKVTDPLRNAQIAAGPFLVTGYALSGFGGVTNVEVAVDDGPFEPAEIVPLEEVVAANPSIRQAVQLQAEGFGYPFRGVWALWSFRWDAPPGRHTLSVRATDATGTTQTPGDSTPEDGFNPIFEVTVEVV